jgi:hypothetical protein
MKPRYTTGTVTGWPITAIALRGGRLNPSPSYVAYVYDSAYGYRPVETLDSRSRYGSHKQRSALQEAERIADELNRKEEQWLQNTSTPGTS